MERQDQDQDQNQDQDKTQARPSHISRKFVKPQQRNVENINPKPQNVAKKIHNIPSGKPAATATTIKRTITTIKWQRTLEAN